ncbi:MAG: response regulator transcription factor [Cellulosilyticum sp.]|nr:response regulator transcription factor [Cellulosilyticum sp.]
MSNNKYKILVIEDEANIRSFIETILEANGYQVLTAAICSQGQLMFTSHLPDLVILDLGLPDRDGQEFIKEVRKSSVLPIIILSARTQESDKVAALDLGANDYITKPFGTGELLARVRATLRNSRHSAEMGAIPGGKFVLKDMDIDYDKRMIMVAGNPIKLTQTEYNIVALLSEHAGKVLTYATIIREIWGVSDSGSIKKLQVNMANIRKKLGSKPGENRYITNELGVGYRMYEECE